jgi:hypothetical protein
MKTGFESQHAGAVRPRKFLMSYGVEFDDQAASEFYSWDLPIELYEEIERHLAEELSIQATLYLRSVPRVPEAMEYALRITWQGERHVFFFRVKYRTDEETLLIKQCSHFPLRG